MQIVVNEDYLNSVNELVNENIALKRQVNDMKIEVIAKEVASHVDEWLDKPYKNEKSTQQDINDFALKITRYIDHRLRD